MSLSAGPAQPFDAERSGLTLGEAVAWALVTSGQEGMSILGWGNTTDAVHMTAPDRNAGGLSRAIAKAFAMSGRSPGEIGLIAAHGTGTIYSDAMEMVAFRDKFAAPRPVFSVKGGVGHTLAAAGLVQILVAGRAISRRPRTADRGVVERGCQRRRMGARFARRPGSIAAGAIHQLRVRRRQHGGRACRRHPRMIRAAAWFCAEHCGVYAPAGGSWEQRSPAFSAAAEIPALVGRPVKYYARMTPETRCCLFAASLVLKHAGWEANTIEIGLISAGSDGCFAANGEYFQDYVANGRTLGRGNLFIYTLPTSALGEVAIALSLTGPCMFIQSGDDPVGSLGRIGGQIISDGEAGGMLGLWSDSEAAVCLLIEPGAVESDIAFLPLEIRKMNPLQSCRKLRDLVLRK